ncbi:MAG: hypothetical protein R3B47_10260 [Bacteroidia bacterium]
MGVGGTTIQKVIKPLMPLFIIAVIGADDCDLCACNQPLAAVFVWFVKTNSTRRFSLLFSCPGLKPKTLKKRKLTRSG